MAFVSCVSLCASTSRLSQPLGARRRGRPHAARRQCARMASEPPTPVGEDPPPSPEEPAGTAPEEAAIDVPAEERVLTPEEAKAELLLLTSTVDRGFSASPAAQRAILNSINLLQASADCEEPLEDERLFGEWELIYTNALDIISLALLTPVASISRVFQNITHEVNNIKVTNIVELEPVFAPVANLFLDERTCTLLEVQAKGTPRAGEPQKMDIVFERATIRQQSVAFLGDVPDSVPALSVPVRSPVGYVQTTYLDDEIRVARAPPTPLVRADGVFLLKKVNTTP